MKENDYLDNLKYKKLKRGRSEMKKILLYLSCMLILGACMKNDPVLENRMDNGIVKVYDSANKEFFTGSVEITKLNKQGVTYVSEKGNVKNGLRDGEYVTYWDNGKINAKINYTDGILNGTSSLFNVFGELLNMSTFVNGELEGPYIEVKKLDNLKIVGTIENNRFVGLYEEYWDYSDYKGLHKSVTYSRESGKSEGWYEEYDKNGKLWERTFYKDGVIHGFREMYLYAGNQTIVDFKGYYYKGKKEGTILRNGYSEKFPIISLNDYKESIKNKFTVNEENFDKNFYTVEYYPNGDIKSYEDKDGYSSLTYDEGFNILELMRDIKERREYVKKAKTEEDLGGEYKYIQDIDAYILGWLLSENLNESQKKDLKTVSDAMQSYLVDIYVRRRTIAVG